MDSDRVEGEAQEGWGKLKDKTRDVVDDAKDALDRDDDEAANEADEADEELAG